MLFYILLAGVAYVAFMFTDDLTTKQKSLFRLAAFAVGFIAAAATSNGITLATQPESQIGPVLAGLAVGTAATIIAAIIISKLKRKASAK